jgi:signal transduction histidine kinase
VPEVQALPTSGTAVAGDGDPVTWYYGERHRLDSLKLLFKDHSLTEKQQMEIYLDIAGTYHSFDQDSAIVYAEQCIVLAQKLGDDEALMAVSVTLGLGYTFKGDYDAALAVFNQIMDIAVKREDKRRQTHMLSMIGFVHANWGKFYTAIDYFLKYLPVCEREGELQNYVGVLTNISELYRQLGNTDIAMQYLKQAEEKSAGLEEGRYNWRMPQVYNEYATIYLDQGDYDGALLYALRADSINPESGTINRVHTKKLLATIYLHRDDTERALYYAKESCKHADVLQDVVLYAGARKMLSAVYLAQKRYQEAETEAFKAWEADSTNIAESRYIVENIVLANIYMGNMGKAASWHKKYVEMNAQYTAKSFQTTVSDLAISYETEKKELRIESLEKERQLYSWLGIAGCLLLVAMGIVLLQIIRNARKQQRLIAAQAVEAGEIGERVRIAEDLHDRLGGSLSAVKIGLTKAESMQNINDKIDECIREVREITNNIMPRSLRLFGLKGALEDLSRQFVNVQFHFFGEDSRLKYNLEYAIYCCTKELVNNALKHSGASDVNVQLIQDKKLVTLTVEDNGCGFDERTVVKGDGLQNIRNRVASCRGKIDIVSSPGKGTETVIELKVES